MKNFAGHTALTKIVSIVLIVTGAIGLLTAASVYLPVIYQIFGSGNGIFFFLMVFDFGLAFLGLVSGVELWRKTVWAFKGALIYFAIQLIWIELPGILWEPTSGVSLGRTISAGYEGVGYFGCGINFFALAMLVFSWLAYKQVRKDAAHEQLVGEQNSEISREPQDLIVTPDS